MIKDIIYGVSSLLVIGFTLSTVKIRQENKKNDKSLDIHLIGKIPNITQPTKADEVCVLIKDLLACKNIDKDFNNKFGKYGVNIDTLRDKWNQIRLDYGHYAHFISDEASNIYSLISISSSVYINSNAFTINIRDDSSIDLEELRDVLSDLPLLIKFKKTNVITDKIYNETISAIANKLSDTRKK